MSLQTYNMGYFTLYTYIGVISPQLQLVGFRLVISSLFLVLVLYLTFGLPFGAQMMWVRHGETLIVFHQAGLFLKMSVINFRKRIPHHLLPTTFMLTLVDTGWCSTPLPFLRSFARHLGWGKCGYPAILKAHDCSFRSRTSPETSLFVMMGSQDWRFGDPRPLQKPHPNPSFWQGPVILKVGQLYQTTSFEISWFLGMMFVS